MNTTAVTVQVLQYYCSTDRVLPVAVFLSVLQVMMRVELLYGAAGVVGSLVSGHLFTLFNATLGHGVVLLIVSSLLHLVALLLAIFMLQVRGGGGQLWSKSSETVCK